MNVMKIILKWAGAVLALLAVAWTVWNVWAGYELRQVLRKYPANVKFDASGKVAKDEKLFRVPWAVGDLNQRVIKAAWEKDYAQLAEMVDERRRSELLEMARAANASQEWAKDLDLYFSELLKFNSWFYGGALVELHGGNNDWVFEYVEQTQQVVNKMLESPEPLDQQAAMLVFFHIPSVVSERDVSFSDAQWRRFLDLLPSYARNEGSGKAMLKAEEAFLHYGFRVALGLEERKEDGLGDEVNEGEVPGAGRDAVMKFFGRLDLLGPLIKTQYGYALEFLKKAEVGFSKTYPERKAYFKEWKVERPFWEAANLYGSFSSGGMRNFLQGYMGLDQEYAAKMELARTKAALEIYKYRRGEYPATLEMLVPEILDVVPVDPFTGKTVVYKQEGDGAVISCEIDMAKMSKYYTWRL